MRNKKLILMKGLNSIKTVILEQNPWWKKQDVPEHLAPPTERPLAKHLWKNILSPYLRRHFIILGPRRVGKTTVMYQTVRHLLKNKVNPSKIQWVRLDHPMLISLSLGDITKQAIGLSKATKDQPLYLFLDELVYAKDWDIWLKTFYDEHWPVVIIASSSATAALQKNKESGVGRWEDLHLPPYLLTELLQLYNKDEHILIPKDKKQTHLHDKIKYLTQNLTYTQMNFEKERKLLMSYGGFPELLVEKQKHEQISNMITFSTENNKKQNQEQINQEQIKQILENAFFKKTQQILRSDAIDKAIYKDIPQSYNISNPIALEKILYTLAGRIAGILSSRSLSSDISDISVSTVEHYLNYLIQTYLVFTLSNYDKNEGDTQRRQKKVYFFDVAIRNAALLREQKQIFDAPSELGIIQENLVACHLYHLATQSNNRLYHWKRGTSEVDFVYDDSNQPLAFEIGSSANHSKKGIKKFIQENPKFKNKVYYVAPDIEFTSPETNPEGYGMLPLDLLLLSIGLQYDQMIAQRFKRKI